MTGFVSKFGGTAVICSSLGGGAFVEREVKCVRTTEHYTRLRKEGYAARADLDTQARSDNFELDCTGTFAACRTVMVGLGELQLR